MVCHCSCRNTSPTCVASNCFSINYLLKLQLCRCGHAQIWHLSAAKHVKTLRLPVCLPPAALPAAG
jgi:hypothetical protein